jgi:hypothetical protein
MRSRTALAIVSNTFLTLGKKTAKVAKKAKKDPIADIIEGRPESVNKLLKNDPTINAIITYIILTNTPVLMAILIYNLR